MKKKRVKRKKVKQKSTNHPRERINERDREINKKKI